jgi:hypothetical protein
MTQNELNLREDEVKLIQRLRLAPPYATITAEKRPTEANPLGEVSRITIQESFLTRDVHIVDGL